MTIEVSLLIATLVALLLTMTWVALKSLRTGKKMAELGRELTRLEDLIHAQGSGMKGVGASLGKVKAQLNADSVRLGELEQVGQLTGDVPVAGGSQVYRQAINLAVDGAEATDLAQRFGLSRGEAELMVSFHQLGEKVA